MHLLQKYRANLEAAETKRILRVTFGMKVNQNTGSLIRDLNAKNVGITFLYDFRMETGT